VPRLAAMPFRDFVGLGNGTAGVAGEWTWFGLRSTGALAA